MTANALYAGTAVGVVSGEPSVDIFDTSDDTYIGHVVYSPDPSADPGYGGLLVSPDDSTVYVGLTGSTQGLARIDTTTEEYFGSLLTFPEDQPNALTQLPDGSKVYVLGNGVIYVVDPTSFTVVDTITGLGDPSDGQAMSPVSPIHQYIWWWSNSESLYYVIDTATDSVLTTGSSGEANAITAFNHDDTLGFTNFGANEVPAAVDTSTFAITPLGYSLDVREGVAWPVDQSNRVWFSCAAPDVGPHLNIYDADSLTLIYSGAAAYTPTAVLFPDGSRYYSTFFSLGAIVDNPTATPGTTTDFPGTGVLAIAPANIAPPSSWALGHVSF